MNKQEPLVSVHFLPGGGCEIMTSAGMVSRVQAISLRTTSKAMLGKIVIRTMLKGEPGYRNNPSRKMIVQLQRAGFEVELVDSVAVFNDMAKPKKKTPKKAA